MKRGRPLKSQIRQNVIEILAVLQKGYGYELHKLHKQIFYPCTREVLYYHLKKGVSLGEFIIAEVRDEPGNYSWGLTVKKTYYVLGTNAKPLGDARVKEHFDKIKK